MGEKAGVIFDKIMLKRGTTLIYLMHLLFWLSYILLNFYVSTYFFNWQDSVARFIFMLLLNVPLYYICATVLVSRFYEQKKYLTYALCALGIFIFSIVMRLWIEPLVTSHHLSMVEKFLIQNTRLFILRVYISQGTVLFVASLLGIIQHKFNIETKLTELKLVKAETDLNLIKAKMNPHFLLNTLNNIYSQSYAEKSKSSEAILQLSQLLQYSIYETANKKIAIEKEIQMIHALIGLYQLKHQNKLAIRFNYDSESIQDSALEIPPMIFFSLVENALKHSAIGIVENSFISITFTIERDRILFVVENSIPKQMIQSSTEHYKGFGRASLRQLMEMEYPDRYSLGEMQGKEVYITTLMIKV